MLNTREGLSDPGDFEKPFRDKLTDLEGVPPQESWETIQTALDHDRGIDRRWYLLVLLLLVGGGGFIGGYWVSRVRMESEQTGAANNSKFQIPDSKFQMVVPELGQLLAGGDCVEVCVDGVDVVMESREIEAFELSSRTTHANREANRIIDVKPENGDVKAKGDRIGVVRNATGRAGNGQAGYKPGKSGPGYYVAGQGLGYQSGAGELQHVDSACAGRNTKPADETMRTTLPGTVSAVGVTDERLRKKQAGSDDDGDSTIQMLNGPLRPVYSGYQPEAGAAAFGIDSIQREKEIAKLPLSEGKDSVEEKKKEFKPSKWTLQLSIGGSYVFKKLSPSEDLYYLTDLTNKNKFSGRNAGYNISVRVRREIGAKTTLMAGISWSRWQTYIGYNYYDVVADSIAVQQITANSIEVNTYFMKRSNEIQTTVQQVGLSVGVLRKVQVLQRTHAVLLEANLYQKIYATTQSDQGGHNVGIQPLHFAIKAGVEKTVHIGAWRFTLTPYIQRYLSSLYTAESMFQFSPLQVGLDVGLLLPLQKK